MEGEGTTDQDYYEFEKLLGEIPKVTSSNPQAVEPCLTDPSPVLETVSLMEQETKFSPSMKLNKLSSSCHALNNGCNIAFNDNLMFLRGQFSCEPQNNGKLGSGNNGHGTPEPGVEQVESNLPDEKSLTLAFEELSLKDGMAMKGSACSSPDHAFLPDGWHQIHLNNSPSKLDVEKPTISSTPTTKNGSFAMPIHPFHATQSGANIFGPLPEANQPLFCSSGVNKYDEMANVQMDVKFHKSNVNELKRQKSEGLLNDSEECQQSLPAYPGAMPVNPEMHTFHLLPRFPIHEAGLAVPAFQQEYYLGSQFPAYTPYQHLCQSNMAWRNMEEEGYCRMLQQYNRRPEVNQIQNGVNSATVYFEMPLSHHVEQCNQNFFWNDNAINRGQNQLYFPVMGSGHQRYYPKAFDGKGQDSIHPHGQKLPSANDLTFPTKDFLEHKALHECGKHIFPEKILTRSHGVNSLRTLKPSSMASNQPAIFVDKIEKSFSGPPVDHPCVQSNTPSLSDGQTLQDSSPDNSGCILALRSMQMKSNSLDEVVGRIYLMAKDQHGCRFLQSKFMEGTPEDVGMIFVEIISHIVELMTDPFGNYLVQKLLEVCNEDQRVHILRTVTRKEGELFTISCDMHGTRAVQKLVETLQTKDQFSVIVASLKPCIVQLIKHINGNHVAQRCLQYLPREYNEFLFDAAVAHCVELATDRQGCCVLQKCIHHSDGEEKCRLMSKITSNSLLLSQDQYGNYVVQYILDQKIPWVMAVVLDQLVGHYGHLSMQKYSSNVVEKCLRLAEEDKRTRIIQELMHNPRLLQILQDQFGNYVIQSALKECKGPLRAAFVDAIRPHVPALRSSPYGRKVLSSPCLKK